MILTTQLTENYYDRARPLFESVKKYWPYRFIPGFIDFEPTDYNGEYYLMRRDDIYTYSDDYPKNRSDFVCPQGGEFIDYIDCQDDEIIIQIDADTIMQRAIMPDELLEIIPKKNQIIAVRGASPAPSLFQVAKNLDFKAPELFDDMDTIYEFTASFMVARADTFRSLQGYIIAYWEFLVFHCHHHAGIQWLISMIANYFFNIKIIDNIYQCGEWYLYFDTKIEDNKLFYNDKKVIFNHHKFNNL
jgi:hypothetical protein